MWKILCVLVLVAVGCDFTTEEVAPPSFDSSPSAEDARPADAPELDAAAPVDAWDCIYFPTDVDPDAGPEGIACEDCCQVECPDAGCYCAGNFQADLPCIL